MIRTAATLTTAHFGRVVTVNTPDGNRTGVLDSSITVGANVDLRIDGMWTGWLDGGAEVEVGGVAS